MKLGKVSVCMGERLGCELVELNLQPDHVHLLIKVSPKCVVKCIKPFTALLQGIKEAFIITVVMKDHLMSATTVHYVIKRSFIFNSGWTRHGNEDRSDLIVVK